ncbi:unnamed protein product [Rodentolepis nana]|uniref:Secreted protein n=1 Tax=Rodentolepis nana TaxID=102285 RepID=A0A0R3TMS3_RODNA|nr:unnamed protein product [Rodentolepis nana]
MKVQVSFLSLVVALVSASSIHNDERYYEHESSRYNTFSPIEDRQPRNYYTTYPIYRDQPQPRDYFDGIDRRPQILPPQPYYENRHRRSPPKFTKPVIHVEDYDQLMSTNEQSTPESGRFRRNSPEYNMTQAHLLDIHVKPRLTDEYPQPRFGAGRSWRSAHKKEDKAVHVAQQRPALQPVHATKNEFRYGRVTRNPPQGIRTLEFLHEDMGRAEIGEEDDHHEIDLENRDHWMETRSKRSTPPSTNDHP